MVVLRVRSGSLSFFVVLTVASIVVCSRDCLKCDADTSTKCIAKCDGHQLNISKILTYPYTCVAIFTNMSYIFLLYTALKIR